MTYIKTELEVKEDRALAEEVKKELEEAVEELTLAEIINEQPSTVRRV